jgi:quercetin dioxygenase-like cupin family protein
MTSTTIPAATATPASRSATLVLPGQGDAFWSFGDLVTFKIGPEPTNGAFSVAELWVGPKGGPPPHVHSREDETFYVLEGTMQFVLEDNVYVAGPGEAFFLPRGKVHTFHNPTDKPAKALVMAAPCGFEKFMKAWATPRSQSATPPPPPANASDMAPLLAACASFGLEMKPDHKPKNAPTRKPATQKSVPVMGLTVDMKLTTEDTAGAFTLVTIDTPPGGLVPVHAHREMDEMFYVERGTVQFDLADRSIQAPAGSTLFVPRGVKHGFRNVGTEPTALADFHFPAGFEHFFNELGEIAPGMKFDVDQVMKLMDKHGMDVG